MTPSVSEHDHDGHLSPGVRNTGRPRSRSCVPLLQPHAIGPKENLEDPDCHAQAPIFPLDLAAEAIAETCRTIYTAHRAAVLDMLASIAQSDVAKEDKGRLTKKSLERRVSGLPNDRSSIAAPLLEKHVTKCPYKYLAGKSNSTGLDAGSSQHKLVAPTLPSICELTSNRDDRALGSLEKPNSQAPSSNEKIEGSRPSATLSLKPNESIKRSFRGACGDVSEYENLPHTRKHEIGTQLRQDALQSLECFSTVERVRSWQSDQIQHRNAPRLRRVESAPIFMTSSRPGHRQHADANGRDQFPREWASGSNNQHAFPPRAQQGNGRSATSRRGHMHGGRPPSGPSRQPRSNVVQEEEEKYPCIYDGSGVQECNSYCARKQKYVSRLRRHHEAQHGFFYCIKCFQRFDDSALRNSHNRQGCGSICVTQGCPNNGGAANSSCNHGKSSQDAIWKALFRLGRPHDQVPDPDFGYQAQAPRFASGLQHSQPQLPPGFAQFSPRSESGDNRQPNSGSEEDGSGSSRPRHPHSLAEMTADIIHLSQLAHELDVYYLRLDPRSVQQVELLQEDMSIALRRLSRLLEDCRSRFPHAVHPTVAGSTTEATLSPEQGSFETPLQREAASGIRQPALSAMFGAFHNVDDDFGVMDITSSFSNTNYGGHAGPPPASFDHNSQQFSGAAYGSRTAHGPYQQQYGNSTIHSGMNASFNFPSPDDWNPGSGNNGSEQ